MKWPSFKTEVIVKNEEPVKRRTAADFISDKQVFRMGEDLFKLRVALDDADNKTLHNREQLHRIYKTVTKDPHLLSQWCTRKLKTMEKEFSVVSENDEQNDELSELLNAQWFMDLIDEIL